MEIAEIKQQLTLAEVLKHYGLRPDKSLRLHCKYIAGSKVKKTSTYFRTSQYEPTDEQLKAALA